MDVHKTLRDLCEEKNRLDRLIARLEQRLQGAPGVAARGRRGRKSMGADERVQVSARMKAYWAERRARADEKARSDARPAANEEPLEKKINA